MKLITGLIAVVSLVIALQVTAMASGIGANFDFNFSGGSVHTEPDGLFGKHMDGDITNISVGGGLVFDSNLMGPGIFNYRLKLGGDYFKTEGDAEFGGGAAHLLNYFGFKIFSSSRARLWIGPMVGLRYIHGEFTGTKFKNEESGILETYFNIGNPFSLLGNIGLHNFNSKYNLLGVEAGLTFGMNFALTELLVLGLEVSGKYMFLYGKTDRTILTLFSFTTISPDFQNAKETYKAHNGAVEVSVSIMFRFSEGRIGRR